MKERSRRRPRTRFECPTERPCPFVGCRYHLYLHVDERTGAIRLNHPRLEPWELEESCALDVAERGEHTLHEIGELLGLTRERVRQVEFDGLVRVLKRSRRQGIEVPRPTKHPPRCQDCGDNRVRLTKDLCPSCYSLRHQQGTLPV